MSGRQNKNIMKNNNIILSIITALFLFTACEKAIIGTSLVYDVEENFELFCQLRVQF